MPTTSMAVPASKESRSRCGVALHAHHQHVVVLFYMPTTSMVVMHAHHLAWCSVVLHAHH
jgi:hypothetical protein